MNLAGFDCRRNSEVNCDCTRLEITSRTWNLSRRRIFVIAQNQFVSQILEKKTKQFAMVYYLMGGLTVSLSNWGRRRMHGS